MKKPVIRKPSSSLVLIIALVILLTGLCLLADALEVKNGWRRDHSFNAVTTQSETTLQVLGELRHPVHIYAVYSKGTEDAPLLELLNRYASASDRITWEQVDIRLNPALIQKYRNPATSETVSSESVVVTCEETGRFRILDATDFYSLGYNMEAGAYEIAGLSYEKSLTEAIRYVALDEIPRVMILQGHGELDSDGTAVLADLLGSNNYEVHYFTFTGAEDELRQGDVLFVLSPVRDLLESEAEKIRRFVQEGGCVLFTCDYSDPVADMPNLQALMRSYGFLPRDGIVIASAEEPASYYNGYQLFLLPIMQSTEVTADLVSSGTGTLLMAGSRAFETPGATDRDLTVWTLLSTTSRAYLRALDGDLSTLEQQDTDELGPFALALQAERITEGGHVSRAVVLGCSTLLTSSEVYAMTDAQEFILRVTEYLAGVEGTDLNIMSRQAVRPSLRAGSVLAGQVLIFLLPACILALALLVLIPRIRRH